jgi:hypothetical protein
MGWLVNATPGLFTPGKGTLYLFYRGLSGPHGVVWAGAENIASTGIRSAERPARSVAHQY